MLAVEFVTAASNLRAACYGIPMQSLFETKVRSPQSCLFTNPLCCISVEASSEPCCSSLYNLCVCQCHPLLLVHVSMQGMAGNIIHAIATTNAIVSGLIVLEALKLLAGAPQACQTSFLHNQVCDGQEASEATLWRRQRTHLCHRCQSAVLARATSLPSHMHAFCLARNASGSKWLLSRMAAPRPQPGCSASLPTCNLISDPGCSW